jgi:hypothetical protein
MIVQVKDNKILGRSRKDGAYDLRPPQSKRSLNLNRFLFGVVYKIWSGELGWDKDFTDKYFRDMFLKSEERTPDGKTITVIKSHKDLDNQQFIDYYKQIQRYAIAEASIYIPDPNEADYEEIARQYACD